MTDPEDTTQLQPADLIEAEVDETPDDERPIPFEAEPADVLEQRTEVPLEDEPIDVESEY